MGRKIQISRGIEANLPTLDIGEFGFTTNTYKLKIGSAGGNIELANQSSLDAETNARLSAQAETTNITDLTFNGVIKGIEISNGGALSLPISAGIAYLNGKRITVNSTSLTLTASKDTYIDLSNDGVIAKVEVANGAAEPALTANSIRIGIAITNATVITTFYRYTRNVGLGEGAYEDNTTGYDNVAIGFQAMKGNTTGHRNVAIGVAAMLVNTTGHHNVALGQNSLLANTVGVYNTALGIDALHDNTIGGYNVAIGQYASQMNISGTNNTAIGISALLNSKTGDGNFAIGQYALTTQDGLSSNMAIGFECFRFNTAGISLVGLGRSAGRANTTGSRNHFIGYESGYANTTGSDNTAFGYYSLHDNDTFNNNTGVGSYALKANKSASCTAIGYQSFYKATTGGSNTGVGLQAGYQIITGDKNTFIGVGSAGTTYQTATDISNSSAIGYNSVINESNAIQLGDTAVTKVYSHGSFECQDVGDSFIMKSPDGTRYKLVIANGGALSTVAA